VLLVFLILGAILGMSFDQTLSFDQFLIKSPQFGFKAGLINFFELYDAFHSWWFSLVIVLLSANLIACSIERLPRIYFCARRPRPFLTDRRLLGLTIKKEIFCNSQRETGIFLRHFFGKKYNKACLEKNSYYFCEHHTLGRFGVYIVHIALLIIMYSAVYATHNGVDGLVMIEEGEQTRFITAKGAGGVNYSYDLGFYIGCNDFRLSTFLDNSPMEYESDLSISSAYLAKPEKTQTVRVNEPLSFAGFTFYQSSFSPVISEKIVLLAINYKNSYKQHRVRLNSEIKLENGDIIIPQKIYDDFGGLGEALRVAKNSPKGENTYFHIFRKYPDFDSLREDSFTITFLGTDQKYATGLSIGKVPGISVIFFGFLLFLVGLYLCFFLTPVRYFARIEENAHGMRIICAAQAFRHVAQVRQEFEKKTSYVAHK
jgi:cytochrome c biogenesis protein